MLCLCLGVEAKKKASTPPSKEHSAAFLHFYYAASRSFAMHEYDDALSLFMLCHTLEPQDAASNWYIGTIFRAMNMPSLSYLREAYEAVPTQYWNPYASVLYDLPMGAGKKQAEKVLSKAAQLAPDDMEITESLMNLYMSEGEYKKALVLLDKMDKHAGSPTTYSTYLRYHAYADQDKADKGLKCIHEYLKDEPSDYYIQVLEGEAYETLHNRGKSEEVYLQIEKQYPANPYVYQALAKYYSLPLRLEHATTVDKQDGLASLKSAMVRMAKNEQQKYAAKAQTLSSVQKWLMAPYDDGKCYEQILKTLIQLHPEESKSYTNLAYYYSITEEYKRAREILQECIKMQPGDSVLWEQMRNNMLKDTTLLSKEILELTKEAHKQMPTNIQWHLYLGNSYLMNNMPDSAIQVLHEGLEIGGPLLTEAPICMLLGDIYSQSEQQADTALAYYELAVTKGMQNNYLFNNYAYLLATSGKDLNKAEKMSAGTIKAEPNNPTFLDTYAWILHLQGQDFLAQYYMRRAWENTPLELRTGEVEEHYHIIIK